MNFLDIKNRKSNIVINILICLLIIVCVGISIFSYTKAISYNGDVNNSQTAVNNLQKAYNDFKKESGNALFDALAANTKTNLDKEKAKLSDFKKKFVKFIVIGALLDLAAIIGAVVVILRIRTYKKLKFLDDGIQFESEISNV